ncbi:MAG: LacI family transcriptional regulator [Lachnospiraceae bacterium]|nr:LacI family transcriptional regulator [Lachnospiraceae bacterium]
MTTVTEIANLLNLSKSTVSKALNNKSDVSPETRRCVLETASSLGYTSSRKEKKTLAVFIKNMAYQRSSDFGYEIVHAFSKYCEKRDYSCEVIPLTDDLQYSRTYGAYMVEQGYAGALLLGLSLIDPWISTFKSARIPTVLFDNAVPKTDSIASVVCDADKGIDEAVQYLRSMGHTRIGLLTGPSSSYAVKQRYRAYIDTVSQAELDFDDSYIGMDYDYFTYMEQRIQQFIKNGITSIICTSDVRAQWAIAACINQGLRVPQDMSIIGYDDLPSAKQYTPRLTTIHQDRSSIGKSCFAVLDALINGIPIDSVVIKTRLIVRDSTGTAPNTEQQKKQPLS